MSPTIHEEEFTGSRKEHNNTTEKKFTRTNRRRFRTKSKYLIPDNFYQQVTSLCEIFPTI